MGITRTRRFRYKEQTNSQESGYDVETGEWDAVASLVHVVLGVVVDQRTNDGSEVDVVCEQRDKNTMILVSIELNTTS